jgi:hypothetical protein
VWLSRLAWPRLALAAACLLGMAAAFGGGALWQRWRMHGLEAGGTGLAGSQAGPRAKERVVLLILDDHLDRSERLLVELSHAAGETGGADELLQTEARQLLPDNRLYRQALPGGSDPMMTAALEHLERVLEEVANSPDKLKGADVERIEREMNTDGLLFQIRVLRTRSLPEETKDLPNRKGATI